MSICMLPVSLFSAGKPSGPAKVADKMAILGLQTKRMEWVSLIGGCASLIHPTS